MYSDSYLDNEIDKANALKIELSNTGTVEDVTINTKGITITNYKEKNWKLDLSTGTVEKLLPVEYFTLKIGDYVNYPVYYNNLYSSYYVTGGERGYKPADEYIGWRILNINFTNKEVKLVSTGIPIVYYHCGNSSTSVTNLTTNFFVTPINNTVTQHTFYKCGFTETRDATSTISSISDLKKIFSNEFTEINEGMPKVQSLTLEDLTTAKNNINVPDYQSSDLFAIPTTEHNSRKNAEFWLATPYNSSLLRYMGWDRAAIREWQEFIERCASCCHFKNWN